MGACNDREALVSGTVGFSTHKIHNAHWDQSALLKDPPIDPINDRSRGLSKSLRSYVEETVLLREDRVRGKFS